jgi:hypothetical protein
MACCGNSFADMDKYPSMAFIALELIKKKLLNTV